MVAEGEDTGLWGMKSLERAEERGRGDADLWGMKSPLVASGMHLQGTKSPERAEEWVVAGGGGGGGEYRLQICGV